MIILFDKDSIVIEPNSQFLNIFAHKIKIDETII